MKNAQIMSGRGLLCIFLPHAAAPKESPGLNLTVFTRHIKSEKELREELFA